MLNFVQLEYSFKILEIITFECINILYIKMNFMLSISSLYFQSP